MQTFDPLASQTVFPTPSAPPGYPSTAMPPAPYSGPLPAQAYPGPYPPQPGIMDLTSAPGGSSGHYNGGSGIGYDGRGFAGGGYSSEGSVPRTSMPAPYAHPMDGPAFPSAPSSLSSPPASFSPPAGVRGPDGLFVLPGVPRTMSTYLTWIFSLSSFLSISLSSFFFFFFLSLSLPFFLSLSLSVLWRCIPPVLILQFHQCHLFRFFSPSLLIPIYHSHSTLSISIYPYLFLSIDPPATSHSGDQGLDLPSVPGSESHNDDGTVPEFDDLARRFEALRNRRS